MKRLLILSECFYPSKRRGGPTTSIVNLVQALSSCFSISLITTIYEMGTHEKFSSVNVGKNRLFGADIYYLEDMSCKSVLTLIKRLTPDVIYTNSLFSHRTTIPAFLYCRNHSNVKLVLSPRGELMPEALSNKVFKKRLYVQVLKKLISKRENICYHVTSEEEEKYSRSFLSDVFGKVNIVRIDNLPSHITEKKQNICKEPGELKVVSICRVHPHKNIDYALEILSNITEGKIVYDIYGSIEDELYYKKCTHIPLPNNVTISFKGIIDHSQIQEILSKYHIFLLPTKSENFGHSIVESLFCSVPVVISNSTPWKDLEDFNAGWAIPLDRKDVFVETIRRCILMNNSEYLKMSKSSRNYIEKKLQNNETNQQYIKLFSFS